VPTFLHSMHAALDLKLQKCFDDFPDKLVDFCAQVLSGGQPAGRQLLHMRGQLSQTHTPTPAPASAAAVYDGCALAGTPKAGESTSLGKGRGVLVWRRGSAGGLEHQIRRPAVVAGVDARGGCADLSFWVHPAFADAAIHAGAALRSSDQTGMMVSVSIGYYGPQRGMHGAPTCQVVKKIVKTQSVVANLCKIVCVIG
jgi:hypothetical protein